MPYKLGNALMIPWVLALAALDTKSMFSLVRSRLFYLVYMQLLVFFTLLFRTPYILYIFWIIYISSYTKVYIFFFIEGMLWNFTILRSMAQHTIGLNHVWKSIVFSKKFTYKWWNMRLIDLIQQKKLQETVLKS